MGPPSAGLLLQAGYTAPVPGGAMFGTYRTVLALMVVLTHLGGLGHLGQFAVFGFYTLSGYLMTLVISRNYGYTTSGFVAFALNRALRIFPLYWLSVVISVALILVVGAAFARAYHPALYLPETLAEAARNFFLVLRHGQGPRLTPPAWALTVELFFYVCIGIGAARYRATTLAWLLLSIAYHAIVPRLGFGPGSYYFSIPAGSLPFALGAAIFHSRDWVGQFLGTLPRALVSWGPAMLGAAILLNWGLFRNPGISAGFFPHFYLNIALNGALVACLVHYGRDWTRFRRVDDWLGGLSYPIYLVHYQVGLLVVFVAGLAGVSLTRGTTPMLLLSLPGVLGLAWLLARFVETPLERVRDAVKDAHARRAPASAAGTAGALDRAA